MGKRKEFIGTVISDKMNKTCIVRTLRIAKHPKYGRITKKYNKYKVHDEKNTAKIGDLVRIQESRPLSKDKRFILLEVVKKSSLPHVELKEEIK
jgi:small subunit ribosomal protein S17